MFAIFKSVKYQQFEKSTNRFFSVVFAIVFLLILAMAFGSAEFTHPDEYTSYQAAKYYKSHSLPPHVNDPDISGSFSVYGHSRLVTMEVYYLLAGKFAWIGQLFTKNQIVAIRLFNVTLFLVLIILFFRSDGKVKPLFLLLLISPQVWYIFSYINSDAIALFFSILIIHQLVNKKSWFQKFLYSQKTSGFLIGAILMALLIVLQFYSKKNYWVFLVFICFVLAWEMFHTKRIRLQFFKKYLIMAGIIAILLIPRFAYDLFLYGPDKNEILRENKEMMAQKEFKHSNAKEDFSYFGIFLRDKGVNYFELFKKPWDWQTKSFYSFVGLYGWMNIFSPYFYYALMFSLYILLFGYIILKGFYITSPEQKTLLVVVILFAGGFISISTIFSWLYDFQAQGRYLFPVLIIFGFWVVKTGFMKGSVYLSLLIGLISLVSIYSFIFVAINKLVIAS